VFADCFATTLKVLAPAEAISAMMHDLQTRGPEIDVFMNRYPRYAKIIGEPWNKVLAQTAKILGGEGVGKTAGAGGAQSY